MSVVPKRTKRALLVIDVQYDFLKGGSLEVPCSNEIIPKINELKNRVQFDLVVFTKDWHPPNHCSFIRPGNASPDAIHPVHCVQNTRGAELHEDLVVNSEDIIILKGQNENIDSYSGFWDNDHKSKTELEEILNKHDIAQNFVCGVATEYCVAFTALDSQSSSFETFVIEDLTSGLSPQQINERIDLMKSKGISLISSDSII
eukprot:TRINITY_DN378_c0_g1_i2.p1 TRINITY_DN378_c0_g1~~TRINITY_DN378_c0_g1_i2.p1  ORF type:complete len:202 (-),score=33.08 TRINITY_DN378_c0_g1_i2:227-832(-)